MRIFRKFVPKESVRKILVVTLSNLGDVILTLPVLQSLLENFPGARLDVLVGASGRVVLEGDGRISRLMTYDKKASWIQKIKFLVSIRHEKYDLIVDLRKSLIGLFGGSPYRNSYRLMVRSDKHKRFSHFRSIRPLVGRGIPEKSFLASRIKSAPLSKKIESVIQKQTEAIFVLAPGSKSDLKKWPADSYARLMNRLLQEHKARLILVGDNADSADAQAIAQKISSPVVNLVGQTSFMECCQVIAAADLVITNDSAPLHLADSLKVPTLALFGPTDPRKYGPRQKTSAWVQKTLFCVPCQKAQCRYQHECMTQLSVDEVHQTAERILKDEVRLRTPKILVIRLDRIGDMVLSYPTFAALRDCYPDARITVMTRPETRDVVSGLSEIDEVMVYDYAKGGIHRSLLGYWRILKEIMKGEFDVVFILHPGLRSNLLAFLAGIPYRIGFDREGLLLLTHRVLDNRQTGLKSESEYAMDIVREFGVEPPSPRFPAFPIFVEQKNKVDEWMRSKGARADEKWIAFHAGASCASKKWPIGRFVELAKKISNETDARLVLIGGAEEIKNGQIFSSLVGHRAVSAAGEFSLKETAALLNRCALLVSNDSGPVHMAASLGVRTFTIFGRNQAGLSVQRWKALGKGHAWIQKNVGCVVCLAHECPIEFECLQAVTVEEVFVRVRQMLAVQAEPNTQMQTNARAAH